MNQRFLFCGSSHIELGREISTASSIPLGRAALNLFPDSEISVEIQEDVWGSDVFVLQTVALDPNFYLMELLILVDALKRSSAKSVTAIIPYFGYCRQDRKDKAGVPITAKLAANLLTVAGVTRLITVDLHAGQLEGFFEIPVDHLHSRELLAKAASNTLKADPIIVAADIGSVKIAEKAALFLNADLAVIEKQRTPGPIKMNLIGDIKGKSVLIADDMCSTATTLVNAAHLCQEKGARQIIGTVTHGLFVEGALEKIEQSPLEQLYITNTVPHSYLPAKVSSLSIATLIARCCVK